MTVILARTGTQDLILILTLSLMAFLAGEVTSPDRPGSLDGAMDSGRREAARAAGLLCSAPKARLLTPASARTRAAAALPSTRRGGQREKRCEVRPCSHALRDGSERRSTP